MSQNRVVRECYLVVLAFLMTTTYPLGWALLGLAVIMVVANTIGALVASEH